MRLMGHRRMQGSNATIGGTRLPCLYFVEIKLDPDRQGARFFFTSVSLC